eukprot:gene7764-12234_t
MEEEEIDLKNLADLPLARVKRIMKSDTDVKLISQEAVLLVTKAAENLLSELAKDSVTQTIKENRKTIQYKDIVNAVKDKNHFDFLEDIVPSKTSMNQILNKKE